MSRADIIVWIDLLNTELHGGLPAQERRWTLAKIAELGEDLAEFEGEGA